jgi:hypothetical protein
MNEMAAIIKSPSADLMIIDVFVIFNILNAKVIAF